ncbi:type II/IV secretion system protein [Bacteriovorax sp. BSW11_IV]|uniref:CpaF/VirB11 family protein n=1 Tax=Bacteriovorax sp. BSW11_IV TaxID=1353529 RepID=UPI00038A43C5|nr:CpaF/VirB11 family protein [Bacteriovorax sp. BSW11_IV]EQC50382.1 type II/IV secretion system protein [Bacteriovorax sp. BSW11_IV]
MNQQINEKITDLFKDEFHHGLDKQNILSFDECLSKVEFKTGLKKEVMPLSELELWYKSLTELSVLSKFIKERLFDEMICHGHDSINFLSSAKKEIVRHNLYTKKDFKKAIEILALKNGVFWNYTKPFASFKTIIADIPFRCTLIHPGLSPNEQTKVFLRRQSVESFTLKDFASESQVKILEELFYNKANIVIAGSTGSGKTSFIKSLLNNCAKDEEHVVILEDTEEINPRYTEWTQLLASNSEGKHLMDYCHYALRMTPDRIVLGEIRSKEVIPFLLSMNNGHKGLMTTVHANSASDTLSRLSLLFSLYSDNGNSISHDAINKMIASSVDIVIFLENKKVKEIARIISWHGQRPTFELLN